MYNVVINQVIFLINVHVTANHTSMHILYKHGMGNLNSPYTIQIKSHSYYIQNL